MASTIVSSRWTRSSLSALLLLLALAASATAETPTIVVPPTVAPYRLVVASTTTDGTGYVWIVVGPNGQLVESVNVVPDGTVKASVAFTGAPGTKDQPARYTIVLIVNNAGKMTQSNTSVVIGEADDDPPIPPPPPPPPPPPVEVQKVQIVVIEETNAESDEERERVRAFSRVRNSKEVFDWKEGGGHSVFFLDKDAATKAGGSWKTWADRASGKQLPYVFVASKKDLAILKECEAPRDVASFLKLVQQYGGVGASEEVDHGE
jgi:hypothetical protein